MSTTYDFPTIQRAFVKSTVALRTQKAIEDNLKWYSEIHELKIEETIYVFIREAFALDMFFEIKEDVRDELLFKALRWASPREKKRKILPTSSKEISQTKDDPYFSRMQQYMTESFFRTHNMNNMADKIELNKYILFFYEMAFFTKIKEK